MKKKVTWLYSDFVTAIKERNAIDSFGNGGAEDCVLHDRFALIADRFWQVADQPYRRDISARRPERVSYK